MKKIISKMFNFLKFILMFIAFALIFIGVLFTYKRLDKSLTDAINIFIPFALVFILTVVNIIYKKSKSSENLLFNFASVLVYTVIIIIGLRAKFDTNMLLYYKYKINYNPSYLADNLSSVKALLYCLSASNIFLIISSLLKSKDENMISYVKASTDNLRQNSTNMPVEEQNMEEL